MIDLRNRRCRGAAILSLLLAFPLPALGEAAPGPEAEGTEEPVEFRPLPPIEFPKKAEPAPPAPSTEPPAEPPPPEPAPATADAAPSEPAEAPPREPFKWPRDPSDRRWPVCAVLTVGLFGSDTDAGVMADLGARILPVTLRYAWRGTFLENGTSTFESLRVSWSWGLWSSSSEALSIEAYAGAGVGELSTSLDASYTEPSSTESASAAVAEGGFVLEWGAIEVFRLGLELIRSTERTPPGAPTFLFGFSVSPIVLLGALR